MARALTPLEARVLGVLVEKHATVPDTYPLSLNSLVAGCNQKTARDPVIEAGDADVWRNCQPPDAPPLEEMARSFGVQPPDQGS